MQQVMDLDQTKQPSSAMSTLGSEVVGFAAVRSDRDTGTICTESETFCTDTSCKETSGTRGRGGGTGRAAGGGVSLVGRDGARDTSAMVGGIRRGRPILIDSSSPLRIRSYTLHLPTLRLSAASSAVSSPDESKLTDVACWTRADMLVRYTRARASERPRQSQTSEPRRPALIEVEPEDLATVEKVEMDAKDRHVLAATISIDADILLTQNTKHFPRKWMTERGIEP